MNMQKTICIIYLPNRARDSFGNRHGSEVNVSVEKKPNLSNMKSLGGILNQTSRSICFNYLLLLELLLKFRILKEIAREVTKK